ncbi:MAG: DUF3025 domain-containing protein [Betaproteobacteria bacterium]|nr:DUF3025 domain-containing protein [Betaproteobacteria bacterium]
MAHAALRSAPEWAAAKACFASPLFDGVRSALEPLSGLPNWPTLDDLNAEAKGLTNARGLPLRFVASPTGASAMQYESRIAETGEIASRECNWHDLFNACAWLSFPAAKGAISDMHAELLAERGEDEARARSVERDVLTLLDEGGIAIACADPELGEAIRGFRWRELFWDRREACLSGLRCFLFGHAQLEKALNPYVGVTARAVIVPVGEVFLGASREAQVAVIDQHLARWLGKRSHLSSTHRLHPFPYLGMPGWFAANGDAAFYDNANYFRSGRRATTPMG